MSLPSQEDQVIGELLERYLGLVDEYTTLRTALAASHQNTLHALARARFTADRGARFGPEQYDDRMQASRRVTVTATGQEPPLFSVVEEESDSVEKEVGGGSEGGTSAEEVQVSKEEEEVAEKKKKKKKRAAASAAAARNPLRWFGVLVPQALRDAQTAAVRTVGDIVPRLASVQAEMAHVEIEVRRARKRRTKSSKKQDATSTGGQAVSALS